MTQAQLYLYGADNGPLRHPAAAHSHSRSAAAAPCQHVRTPRFPNALSPPAFPLAPPPRPMHGTPAAVTTAARSQPPGGPTCSEGDICWPPGSPSRARLGPSPRKPRPPPGRPAPRPAHGPAPKRPPPSSSGAAAAAAAPHSPCRREAAGLPADGPPLSAGTPTGFPAPCAADQRRDPHARPRAHRDTRTALTSGEDRPRGDRALRSGFPAVKRSRLAKGCWNKELLHPRGEQPLNSAYVSVPSHRSLRK